MDKVYNNYKNSIKSLSNNLNSIIKYQKKVIAYYQSQIDDIKNNSSLDDKQKEKEINEYLKSISKIHDLLREDNIIINLLSEKTKALSYNIEQIVKENEKIPVKKSLTNTTKSLRQTIENECEKIYALAQNVKDLFNKQSAVGTQDNREVIDSECENLYHLNDEINSMLDGINFNINSDDSNKEIRDIINDLVAEERQRVDYISSEAYHIMCAQPDELISNRRLELFYEFIKEEYDKLSDKLMNMDFVIAEINHKDPTNTDKISINLLQEVIEEESRKLVTSLHHLDEFLSIIDDEDKDTEIVEKMYSIKDDDTKNYKHYCSILEKSLWNAWQKISLKKIKHPSPLYEQKIKEYQNNYLIDNYNVSLEDVNSVIESYKEKYAEDIYINDIYDEALSQLKDEYSLSIEELCNEEAGLSLLDQRAYQLLEKDLHKIEKSIASVKDIEDINSSLSMNQYRKSFKTNKLKDQKNIIEHQMDIIKKRADKLESLE